MDHEVLGGEFLHLLIWCHTHNVARLLIRFYRNAPVSRWRTLGALERIYHPPHARVERSQHQIRPTSLPWLYCPEWQQVPGRYVPCCQGDLAHGPLGDLDVILKVQISILFYWLICLEFLDILSSDRWMPQDLTDDKLILVQVMACCYSGNGLVLSGNKPLPEPMLTIICITVWCHWATMTQPYSW